MAQQHRDYYDTLGVARDADAETIKRAFKKLAREYHPDRNKSPDAAERFKKIAEAYSVLSDPQKRSQYDRGGFAGVAGFTPEDLFGGLDLGDHFAGFGGGLFEHFFGGRRGRPPEDEWREVELRVPLQMVLTGGEQTLFLNTSQTCESCNGTGAAKGTSPKKCEACDGRGQQVAGRQEGGVTYRQITTCPQCHGRGVVIEQPCPDCHGRGETEHVEPVSVRIPAGAEEGAVLRVPLADLKLREHGRMINELHVVVRTRPHPRFQRRGPDLICEQSIDVVDAVLGTKISLETLDAAVTLTIPPQTQPNAVLRLRGEGLPYPDGSHRGDLHVIVRVHVPKSTSAQERELYEQLRQLRQEARSSQESEKRSK
jgi:molecular chaperone DnaJ